MLNPGPTWTPIERVPGSLSQEATGFEADRSRPLGVEVKNEWNYTSTFPYDFTLIRGTTLPIHIPVVHLFLCSDEKLKIGPAELNIVTGHSMKI